MPRTSEDCDQKRKHKLRSRPLKIGNVTYYTYKQAYKNSRGETRYRNITMKKRNKSLDIE